MIIFLLILILLALVSEEFRILLKRMFSFLFTWCAFLFVVILTYAAFCFIFFCILHAIDQYNPTAVAVIALIAQILFYLRNHLTGEYYE